MNVKWFLAGAFFLLSPLGGYALFNGSSNLPELPEENLFISQDAWYSLKLSYRGDFVFSRSSDSSTGLSDIHMKSMFNGSEISFGFIDRVELYTVLGAFTSSVSASHQGEHVSLKLSESFGGSVGSRVMAICWGETKLGFNAEYFYGWPLLKSLQVGRESSDSDSQSNQRQWQVGVNLSQKFGFLTPYVGGSYSRFILDVSGLPNNLGLNTIQVENSSPYGVCIGLAIAGRKGAFLDIEASFLSEYSVSGMVGLRF